MAAAGTEAEAAAYGSTDGTDTSSVSRSRLVGSCDVGSGGGNRRVNRRSMGSGMLMRSVRGHE